VNEERDSEEKGFVVIDRRGEADDEEAAEARSETSARDRDPSAPGPGEAESPAGGSTDPLPQMDFSTLLHSFAISALYHLGIAPGPDGQTAQPDLTLAKQNIDILEVLGEKTAGNLTDEERQLLDGILYEVRMRFVEISKAPTN